MCVLLSFPISERDQLIPELISFLLTKSMFIYYFRFSGEFCARVDGSYFFTPVSARSVVQELAYQLPNESEDDKTILMHAARSGDAMTLKLVSSTCRKILAPYQV